MYVRVIFMFVFSSRLLSDGIVSCETERRPANRALVTPTRAL